MKYTSRNDKGAISGTMIAIIGLALLLAIVASLAIWAYLNYNEQKNNVDGKISVAVAEAKKEQAEQDEEKFAQREKEPLRQFVGPQDYGRVTFDYPKTWSVYEDTDISKSGGAYEAYLNPIVVPPVDSSDATKFALRVTIEEKNYDQVIKGYDEALKKGDLKSSAFASNGINAVRFDGNITKDIRGALVVYKIRDKTLTIRTDADVFKPDFENLIKTINFNN